MKKFLVIGGLHGDEPLGLAVCKRLEKLKLPYLDVLYGNPAAIKKNVRFIQEDLNRVFPGNPKGSVEARRATEIVEICSQYDYVIDFHNTYCPDNDCTFLGSISPEAFQLSGYLGLDRVILADAYDSINKYVKNCLSVEISISSPKFNVAQWVDKMTNLNNFDPNRVYSQPTTYAFVYRITREQQDKFKFLRWKAFRALPPIDVKPLKFRGKERLYPIFVDDKYTPYNYAALVKRIPQSVFFG